MSIPMEISFRYMLPTAQIVNDIEREVGQLVIRYTGIQKCSVLVQTKAQGAVRFYFIRLRIVFQDRKSLIVRNPRQKVSFVSPRIPILQTFARAERLLKGLDKANDNKVSTSNSCYLM